MAYELWELKHRWRHGDSRELLLATLRAGSLPEGVSVPLEVDLLDYLPALIDPAMGAIDMEAENVALAAEIEKSICERGIWLSRSRTLAVTRTGDG